MNAGIDLPQIAHANCESRFVDAGVTWRTYQCYQEGDDRNHHEKFNQREALGRFAEIRTGLDKGECVTLRVCGLPCRFVSLVLNNEKQSDGIKFVQVGPK